MHEQPAHIPHAQPSISPYLRLVRACGWASVLIGIFGLVGWIYRIDALNSIIPGYKPIALSMAVVAILLGAVQLLLTRPMLSAGTRITLLILTLLITLFGVLEILLLVTGIDVTLENAVLRHYPALYANPNAHISPVAGFLTSITGLSYFLLLAHGLFVERGNAVAHLIGILGSLILVTSTIFFLSYIFGTPILYGGRVIPIAWLATLAFILLGIGIMITNGTDAFPLNQFAGTSTRAQLLRAFLPLSALLLLLLSVLQYFLSRLLPFNPAILVAVIVILFLLIITTVILQVARVVGGLIDRAEQERLQAVEELRQSEQDLNRAQAVAKIGSWRLDVHRNELRWSDETYRLFGIPRGTSMTYDAFLAAIHPDDRARVDQQWTAALHGEPYDVEHRIVVDDAIYWVRERAELDFDAQETLVGGFGTVQDVTERVQAEQERERLLAEVQQRAEELRQFNETLEQRVHERTSALEQTLKEMETFSYSVAHDLRSPLRSVDGFSRYLLEHTTERLNAREQDYLRRMRASSQRMARLIDDLLNLARIGRIEMHIERVDLSRLATEIVNGLRQRDRARRVVVDITPGLVVDGDRGLLEIALEHLLENAWKFTVPCEEAHITFGVRNEARVFFVRDNGVGFNMAYIDKLFLPFQRLHTEDEFPGTGIGLALVRRIVERHGGRIWAEGKEGEGATFSFTLSDGT